MRVPMRNTARMLYYHCVSFVDGWWRFLVVVIHLKFIHFVCYRDPILIRSLHRRCFDFGIVDMICSLRVFFYVPIHNRMDGLTNETNDHSSSSSLILDLVWINNICLTWFYFLYVFVMAYKTRSNNNDSWSLEYWHLRCFAFIS